MKPVIWQEGKKWRWKIENVPLELIAFNVLQVSRAKDFGITRSEQKAKQKACKNYLKWESLGIKLTEQNNQRLETYREVRCE